MDNTTFNLQMFGTNDTITSSRDLNIELGFVDGDTRTIKIANPQNNLESSTFAGLSTWIETENILIGDKMGASSSGINSALIVESAKTKLDIS